MMATADHGACGLRRDESSDSHQKAPSFLQRQRSRISEALEDSSLLRSLPRRLTRRSTTSDPSRYVSDENPGNSSRPGSGYKHWLSATSIEDSCQQPPAEIPGTKDTIRADSAEHHGDIPALLGTQDDDLFGVAIAMTQAGFSPSTLSVHNCDVEHEQPDLRSGVGKVKVRLRNPSVQSQPQVHAPCSPPSSGHTMKQSLSKGADEEIGRQVHDFTSSVVITTQPLSVTRLVERWPLLTDFHVA